MAASVSAGNAARGHATAVDAPAPGPGVSREESAKVRRYELGEVRHDWRRSEIQKIYDGGLMETIFRAVCPFFLHSRQQGCRRWCCGERGAEGGVVAPRIGDV